MTKENILNIKQKILLLNSNSALRNQFQNNKNIYISDTLDKYFEVILICFVGFTKSKADLSK